MNRRNFKSESRRAILNVIFVALLAALIGVPLYLGLWQLAVYPAVIGGLVLFWMFLEYRARTDPDDALGFLDHGHAMRFAFLFGMPSMLFLAGWTIYLALGRDPILSRSALVIAGLVLSLLILSGPLSELFAGLFAEQRARKRRGRKPRKGAKEARKSWLRWIAPLFRPYLLTPMPN
jgi:small-conductance mechanosensitive channel